MPRPGILTISTIAANSNLTELAIRHPFQSFIEVGQRPESSPLELADPTSRVLLAQQIEEATPIRMVKMPIAMPTPIASYFAAERAQDPEALARCFTEEGVVRDEGGRFEGASPTAR
jgi:hypothetical protein